MCEEFQDVYRSVLREDLGVIDHVVQLLGLLGVVLLDGGQILLGLGDGCGVVCLCHLHLHLLDAFSHDLCEEFQDVYRSVLHEGLGVIDHVVQLLGLCWVFLLDGGQILLGLSDGGGVVGLCHGNLALLHALVHESGSEVDIRLLRIGIVLYVLASIDEHVQHLGFFGVALLDATVVGLGLEDGGGQRGLVCRSRVCLYGLGGQQGKDEYHGHPCHSQVT